MWKLALGFAAFAALFLFILSKAGGSVDMGGEKHMIEPADYAASAPAHK